MHRGLFVVRQSDNQQHSIRGDCFTREGRKAMHRSEARSGTPASRPRHAKVRGECLIGWHLGQALVQEAPSEAQRALPCAIRGLPVGDTAENTIHLGAFHGGHATSFGLHTDKLTCDNGLLPNKPRRLFWYKGLWNLTKLSSKLNLLDKGTFQKCISSSSWKGSTFPIMS